MKNIVGVLIALLFSVAVLTSAGAADYSALRCVMETHPEWPAVTEEDMVVWLNTDSISYRPTNAPSRDIWDVIVFGVDYDSLVDADRDLVRTTLFAGGNSEIDISVNTTPASTMFIRVFTGTPTLAALNNAFTYQQSPCESISWGAECHQGDVQNALLSTCIP